ncbi:glycosyltransferase [Microbacterium sp. zg.Y909]|uniref:glycosyltransferase n=1 Tax=Microbacterium sp. zg.Y909 TaxID=2969413 RepID=UPI00214AE805|nr:glycosyltransferase [Microbacterium sp. zg.Y909]MCR2823967.1 glycosyltransferase [Microbacterium sp. zg.Y909]
MRVLAVVTLVSPHGEYGGPLRVAVNQLQALAARGHEVLLCAAARGFDVVPDQIDGVPARLYPARNLLPGTGFAGLASPALWRAVRKNARDFDVVHIHAARDLVTLPAARIAQRQGVRTLLQTHGMIDESSHPLAAPLDAMLTRPALKAATAVTHLTERERRSLVGVGRNRARLVDLPNGVPPAEQANPRTTGGHLLYLARLAPRKRPALFVEAATRLAPEFPDATFALVGPDEGEGDAVREAIARSGFADRIRWEGPLAPERTAARMREATGYVLPSVDEPYPMSVLEAMAAGLPVVVTDTCGLAPVVAKADAGAVIDDRLDSLTDAMRGLLQDPQAARTAGLRGRSLMREEFTMDAIAARLEQHYAG